VKLTTTALVELAQEFDRLRGTNVCRVGTARELAIDEASGRAAADEKAFRDFLRDEIFPRIPGLEEP